jgi:hypothetical protein
MLKEDIKRKEVIKTIKISKINAVKELQLKYEQKAKDLKRRLSLQSASYDDDLNAMLFKIETQRNSLYIVDQKNLLKQKLVQEKIEDMQYANQQIADLVTRQHSTEYNNFLARVNAQLEKERKYEKKRVHY